MNLLRLASLFVVPAVLASAALACGEISDPTQNGESTATVSGALTGTAVPAGARVAVVWRNGTAGGVVVGAEAPIVDGKFTMTLTTPSAAYFFPTDESEFDSLNGGNDAPNVSPPPPTATTDEGAGVDPGGSSGSSGASGSSSGSARGKIGTRTNVSGGITEPLSVATAGFVVYLDTNGNGKLDLEGEYASSPDTLLGGNSELLLTYLKGGGSLDYEKLRDKSGILPATGYNLAWDQGRWLPLSLVELKITNTVKLPYGVCSSSGSSIGSSGSGGTANTVSREPSSTPVDPDTDPPPAPDAGTSGKTNYPSPTDPNVHCYDNGNAYYYTQCPPSAPQPVGLCATGYGETAPCAGVSESFAGTTPPDGWPCTVTGPSSSGGSSGGSSSGSVPPPSSDGGAAPDSGGI